MTRVAQRYHVDGQRQSAIAKDLSMSQATVSRMLKRAQKEGIVRISLNVPQGATHVTTRLAQLTGAESVILQAPAVAASREAKIILLGENFVREATEQFDNISLAFIGIGAVEPSDMLAQSGNIFSAPELKKLTDKGAVAEMSQRYLNKEGKQVLTPLNERVIGMTLEQLNNVPRVVALAGGKSKTQAIDAALKSKTINILVTDRFTATRLTRL